MAHARSFLEGTLPSVGLIGHSRLKMTCVVDEHRMQVIHEPSIRYATELTLRHLNAPPTEDRADVP